MTKTVTLQFTDELLRRLATAAAAHRTTLDAMVVACVEQHVEVALRHRVLLERMEAVDTQVDAIARFIEEATSGGQDAVDLSRICRYPRQR